jgi:hypothetical protein
VGTAGFGNHKHNDLLGFEYHVEGTPLLVDPGSYVYTSDPDARNLFRRTASHNTLSIDGEEQNEINPEWLFRMFEKSSPEHLEVEQHEDVLRYRGRHHGYSRLPQPVVHERTFTLARRDGAVTMLDVLTGSGIHRLRWHFHCAPGVEVQAAASGPFDIRLGDLVVQLTPPAGLGGTVGPAWYSPSYGVRMPCVCLDFEVADHLQGRREFTWQIARRPVTT